MDSNYATPWLKKLDYKFFYPLLLLIWISLVICHVPKELVFLLYSLRVEEKEVTPIPDSGTQVIGIHALGLHAVLTCVCNPTCSVIVIPV